MNNKYMEEKIVKKHKKLKITLLIIVIIVAVLFLASAIYLADYYHADEKVYQIINASDENVVITEKKEDYIIFEAKDPIAGIIFYPGAKVEYEAYAPLMEACAQKGITCILVKELFNLSILSPNRADSVKGLCPEIENWYIAGHSLGGVSAAKYAANNLDYIKGVVFLASYSSVDLSNTNLRTLSIVGSNDKVLNWENYENSKKKLPDDSREEIIEGGCHGYFASYGAQKGDGEATITNEEQINKTADLIYSFIKGESSD